MGVIGIQWVNRCAWIPIQAKPIGYDRQQQLKQHIDSPDNPHKDQIIITGNDHDYSKTAAPIW